MGPSEDPFAGTPYTARRLLGTGAQGAVWEAEHRQLRKIVAIKLLHAHMRDDLALADRMRLEAQALVACESPHLVSVLDLATRRDGAVYFVMERLEGQSLKELLAVDGPLSVELAVDLAQQLLAGLAVAHEAGLVHRDIKPGNVHLCPSPATESRSYHLKILDFGVAKLVEGAEGDPAVAPLMIPTATGVVVGTPRYLSPEQVLGEKVDARADLYAAALVLYEMLVGHGPFQRRRTMADMLVAQAKETPQPPSAFASQPIPPALDHVILRALAKSPDDRYQSAGELSAALGFAVKPSAPTMPIDRYEEATLGPTEPLIARTEPMPRAARPPGARVPPPRSPRRGAAYGLLGLTAALLLLLLLLVLLR